MMESKNLDDLKLLAKALRQPGFRFVLIGHRHPDAYRRTAAWLREQLPGRHIREWRLRGLDWPSMNQQMGQAAAGELWLIPDFDWLLQDAQAALCTSFNQRRDALAKRDVALLCFLGPSAFRALPQRLPDWWALRDLELFLEQEKEDDAFAPAITLESTPYYALDAEGKAAEIARLHEQIAASEPDNALLLARLHNRLADLYKQLSRYAEAEAICKLALEAARAAGDAKEEAAAWNNWANVTYALGRYEQAMDYAQKALKLCEESNEVWEKGVALNCIGQIYYAKGDHRQALDYLEQGLAIARQVGDRQGESAALNNISHVYHAEGDYDQALNYLEQSLAIARQIGDRQTEEVVLNNISHVYHAEGDYDQALNYLEQSLAIARQIGDRRSEGLGLSTIGSTYYIRGDYNQALDHWELSLAIARQIGHIEFEAMILANIGKAHLALARYEEALLALWQAKVLAKSVASNNAAEYERLLAIVKAQIGEAAYERILAEA